MSALPSKPYDILVVGAGPAGALTARELARRRCAVLLVDKAAFPRPKVCGCCVNPRALATLDRLGLGGRVSDLAPVPLTSFELAAAGRRGVVRHRLGVAVSRSALDDALVKAAIESGADFLPSTRANLETDPPTARREARLRVGELEWVVSARRVVWAAGLSAGPSDPRPDSRIGAGTIAPAAPSSYVPQRIHMACGRRGYVGLVVLEDGRLDIAAALDPQAIKTAGGLGELAVRILDEAGLPSVPGLADLPWKGTPPLTRPGGDVAADGVFRVGDAAGYVEPFTGEGIAWALAGGAGLAAILAETLGEDLAVAQRRWRAVHRREVVGRQAVCRVAARVLRDPFLTRTLAGLLGRVPALAGPVLRRMHHA